MMVILAALLAPCHFCFSQDTSADGIHSHGEAVLERKPEVMRMSVNLLAKGKNMTDAIAKLKARRAKVEEQLVTLGALKESLKFGEIHLDQMPNNRRRQMERMVQQRMSQKRGKNAKGKAAAAPPVDLSMSLVAEWPLKAAEGSELLVATHKLQEAIKAADLAGAKDAEEPSEEDEEAAAEMENFGGYMDPNEQKPGEPSFIFVSKVSAADRQKATTEAFVAAKAEATKLAEAAQLELGALKSLSTFGGIDAGDDPMEYNEMYRSGFGSFMRQQMSGRNRTNEALGMTPGTLKYKVSVNATFALTSK